MIRILHYPIVFVMLTMITTVVYIKFIEGPKFTNPYAEKLEIHSNTSSHFKRLQYHKKQFGSKQYFRKVTSGTCSSNGLLSIDNANECFLAAQSYEIIHNSKDLKRGGYQYGCLVLHNSPMPQVYFNQHRACEAGSSNCECTQNIACLCAVGARESERVDLKADGQYLIRWTLSLGAQESLLQSAFLKAGLEQSIKDYINNDIRCRGDSDSQEAKFFSVIIEDGSEDLAAKRKAISGNGKCTGKRKACNKMLEERRALLDLLEAQLLANLTQEEGITEGGELGEEGEEGEEEEPEQALPTEESLSRALRGRYAKQDVCASFLQSSIFDEFKDKVITASAFNYDVDVDIIKELEGIVKLKYDVIFTPLKGDGLDEINEIALVPDEPIEISTECVESQCFSQKDVIQNVFNYFEIPFEEEEHECYHQGINCDEADLVTHIWLMNYGFPNKTIPPIIGSLVSLKGLFLGGNGLVGTIPIELARLRKLKLLWLENNKLTGTIPSQFGNLRGLVEINFNENELEGTIPLELGKSQKLHLLNLGRNKLNGTIPSFSLAKQSNSNIIESCTHLPNPFSNFFKKLFISQDATGSNEISVSDSLADLKILSLHDNLLTGEIPTDIALLTNLEDLSLSANTIEGTLPMVFGGMKNLRVIDIHDNAIDGTIPTELGNLRNLRILNLFNNSFESAIPSEIGQCLDLRELVLDENGITNSIPSELGNLIHLESLTFGRNNMSGAIPSDLGKCLKLKNLDLRDYEVTTTVNKMAGMVTGTIPSQLGNLKFWKYPVFENNSIMGTIPSEFGNLESAEIIWVQNQSLSGAIPSEIGKLNKLSHLSVGQNKLTGRIPTSFGSFEQLRTLELGDNDITGEIPLEITNISTLTFLGLGRNKITGEIPSGMANLTNLEFMILGENNLRGEIPSSIGEIDSLVCIDFGDNELSGSIPTEIGNIESLEVFVLGGNDVTGMIPNELGKLTLLQSLDLGQNKLTGRIPTSFGSFEQLRTLELGGNDITGMIPSELGKLTLLQSLDLGGNMLIGQIPTELGQLESLESIGLANNSLTGSIPSSLELLNKSSFEGNDLAPSQQQNLSTALPSPIPRSLPSASPFLSPTLLPSQLPTSLPTLLVTSQATSSPSPSHSSLVPTLSPSLFPTQSPSLFPTKSHSLFPTQSPSLFPMQSPSLFPSQSPLLFPTQSPSLFPTQSPLVFPTQSPLVFPTQSPTLFPTQSPLVFPTQSPSLFPTQSPSLFPTQSPSLFPTQSPTLFRTQSPLLFPTHSPSLFPTLPQTIPPAGPTEDSLIALEPHIKGQDYNFGHEVAISSNYIYVAAKRKGSFVCVFTHDGEFVQQLIPKKYGGSLAAHGDIVAVGSLFAGDEGIVYLYSATTNNLTDVLEPPSSSVRQKFGSSVAVSNEKIVVGAKHYRGTLNRNSRRGAVYIFNAETKNNEKIILVDDLNENLANNFNISLPSGDLFFGIQVAISGQRIYVTSGKTSCFIFVFDLEGNLQLLLTEHADSTEISLHAKDDLLIVGSISEKKAFFYEMKNWNATLMHIVESTQDKFGHSVSITSKHFFVGAPSRRGFVSQYTHNGTLIRNIEKEDSKKLGFAISTTDAFIVMSDIFFDYSSVERSGIAYIYKLDNQTN